MFKAKDLLMLFGISVVLIGCGIWKKPTAEPTEPAKVWTVQAGVENTPAYDGVCGAAGEFIVTRAR